MRGLTVLTGVGAEMARRVRVARLLRSTEGVGAESDAQSRRVAGSRGRGVATHRVGKQAGRWWRGTNGRHANETMAWQAS